MVAHKAIGFLVLSAVISASHGFGALAGVLAFPPPPPDINYGSIGAPYIKDRPVKKRSAGYGGGGGPVPIGTYHSNLHPPIHHGGHPPFGLPPLFPPFPFLGLPNLFGPPPFRYGGGGLFGGGGLGGLFNLPPVPNFFPGGPGIELPFQGIGVPPIWKVHKYRGVSLVPLSLSLDRSPPPPPSPPRRRPSYRNRPIERNPSPPRRPLYLPQQTRPVQRPQPSSQMPDLAALLNARPLPMPSFQQSETPASSFPPQRRPAQTVASLFQPQRKPSTSFAPPRPALPASQPSSSFSAPPASQPSTSYIAPPASQPSTSYSAPPPSPPSTSYSAPPPSPPSTSYSVPSEIQPRRPSVPQQPESPPSTSYTTIELIEPNDDGFSQVSQGNIDPSAFFPSVSSNSQGIDTSIPSTLGVSFPSDTQGLSGGTQVFSVPSQDLGANSFVDSQQGFSSADFNNGEFQGLLSQVLSGQVPQSSFNTDQSIINSNTGVIYQ